MFKKFGSVLVVIFVLSTLCLGAAVTKSPVITVTNTPATATVSPTATPKVETITLKTQKDKLSYSLGIDIAKTFKNQEIEVNPELLMKGLIDGLSGNKPLLTEEEMNEAFTTLQNDINTKNAERQAKLGVQNQKESDAFFAANKTKEGVITLPSGIQYKELTAGNGSKPTADDTVTVNYRCILLDGTEVDSSYMRGEPAKFTVSGVIPGWSEALQLMNVGAKWQLFIPPNLAYGANGAGSAIGPNMALTFEVELISIEPK
jgi:FKBP-type peptidyl-prolyl cis-trans isomerase FklB